MNLRSQLILAGALTLVVPLVGWQSAKQLYVALQQSRVDEQSLKVSTMRLALSESSVIAEWLAPSVESMRQEDWYAEQSRFPLFLDGYDDDWITLTSDWRIYPENITTLFRPSDIERVFDSVATDSAEISGSDATESTAYSNSAAFRLATYGQQLHWFIRVRDEKVIYHRIPEMDPNAGENELPDRFEQLVNGDSVEILLETSAGEVTHALFRAIAPGPVAAVTASDTLQSDAGRQIRTWQGFWSRTLDGYQLEVSMPLPGNGSAIGMAVFDVDDEAEKRSRWIGSLAPDEMARHGADQHVNAHARLFYASDAVASRLEGWTGDGVRARLFNSDGWLIGDVNKLYTSAQPDLDEERAASLNGLLDALLFRIFSFMVADDLPLLPERQTAPVAQQLSEARRELVADGSSHTARYVTVENDRVLGTLAPIGQNPQQAFLLLEANEEHTSAYTGSQLARLFSLLLLVSLLVGCGLLVFAIVLSSRIRRLSHEAQLAVGTDGRVSGLTGSVAKDEIGDLSRNLSGLLSRSAQYNHYLEALSSRLSHELTTPLSVVRTSLENIDSINLDEQSLVLVERAQGGANQLGRIIKALVDSTRLEQTVLSAAKERINLAHWLHTCTSVYQQIHPDLRFSAETTEMKQVYVTVSPELLQQALDKLIDNAASFSTDGSVSLGLSISERPSRNLVTLSVCNEGPAIDEKQLTHLFEPLVSHRIASAHGQVHLGMGLYMVRLIAEGAGGTVFARNRSAGVEFGLRLPVT